MNKAAGNGSLAIHSASIDISHLSRWLQKNNPSQLINLGKSWPVSKIQTGTVKLRAKIQYRYRVLKEHPWDWCKKLKLSWNSQIDSVKQQVSRNLHRKQTRSKLFISSMKMLNCSGFFGIINSLQTSISKKIGWSACCFPRWLDKGNSRRIRAKWVFVWQLNCAA